MIEREYDDVDPAEDVLERLRKRREQQKVKKLEVLKQSPNNAKRSQSTSE